ncbi:MAG TPA: hypothetical protein VGL84_00320 [Gaiellaceae bacterium]
MAASDRSSRYAQLATIDLGFLDIFALLVDEAEPYIGQVVAVLVDAS